MGHVSHVPSEVQDPLSDGDESDDFDFQQHRQNAVDEYQKISGLYADLARAVYLILKTCIDNESITVHSIEHRAKGIESFGDKASRASDEDPRKPAYPAPLNDITDLAGVRVITFFLSTVNRVDPIITNEFEILEKTNRSELLEQEEKLGYHSIHYLVSLRANRCDLPEYARFAGLTVEVQVRTILQHAWAEIEHDIQYKAVSTLPATVRRRFMTLAGMLEVADREFQAIEDEDGRIKEEARRSVAEGRLQTVEITPDALRAYLDKKLGADGRMADWGYIWSARLLRALGFEQLSDVDDAVSAFNDDHVSRVIHGTRQGQLSRFEDLLMAAMGDDYVHSHPWAKSDELPWWRNRAERHLQSLRDAGVEVGTYIPTEKL